MEQNNMPGSPKEMIRANFILSLAMITGASIFLLVALGLVMGKLFPATAADMVNILLPVVGGVAAIALINARMMYKKKIDAVKDKNVPLMQKLHEHRAALILYFALCEGPALFAIIVYMLTGSYYLVIIAAVMIIMMGVKFPTKKRVTDDLQLNWQEQQELN